MKIFYTDHFELPLPPGHRFPMDKYRRLRRRIVSEKRFREDVLMVPPAATDAELVRVHTPSYVESIVRGTLDRRAERRIGFPHSAKMVERSRRSTGATMAAARAAVDGDRVSVNLAGGTHHAMRDAGEGYCVFNDAAVTLATLIDEGAIGRGVVVDLDVHQGNGTAETMADRDDVFTFSMHGEKNFPLRKFPSDLDVDLPDGTADDRYLGVLDDQLAAVTAAGPFDLVIYLAGADPFVGDRLGRLALSKSGLARRDRRVLQWAAGSGTPVAITMAGGYAPDVDDIVDIHAATVAAAAEFAR